MEVGVLRPFTPFASVGLHLEPSEFQMAMKWWLGIPVAQGQSCSQPWMLMAIMLCVASWGVMLSLVTTG